MKAQCFLILTLIFSVSFGFTQELTKNEAELYQLIMAYRKRKNLPKIPLSPSLTYVAQTHSKDLAENRPDVGNCNAHSWSDNGKWTSCCYTSDHAKASCMWDKPKELSNYEFPGYEISCVSSDELTPEEALNTWKLSKAHNNVIVNKGIWDTKWEAIGIGMYEGYATVWFGHYPEPEP